MTSVAHMKELRNQQRMLIGNPEGQVSFTRNGRQNKMTMSYTESTLHHEDTDGHTDRRVLDRLLLHCRLIYGLFNDAVSAAQIM
jgi:hypothetical protein